MAAEVRQSLINSFVVLAGFQRYIEPVVASQGHQGLRLLAANKALRQAPVNGRGERDEMCSLQIAEQ
ncbi:hypothetical protein [Paraburkholderia pallida]|uniref:Uncharacterized protein n=1 Tax=Paraburkholderia pallida TaxID=2547399 RepID=A0A4P7CY95_9BURK|nr:hypothetical protein [Paraburkholderia pallida]QBQ99101.1 hypothetical protein E1956_17915 [Paraburkholderia pallida]